MANSKSWPQKGDKYFFVFDDLGVGHGIVTDDVYSDAYERQTARRRAGNFFRTFEEAKKVVQKYIDQINAPGEKIRKLKDMQQHPHWISVKDRKPELKHSFDNMKYSDTVIVTNGKYCTSARWLHYTWAGWYSWYDDGEEEVKDVTHWMPMPAPPKKGGL